ncbi:hypothetical protein ACTID9_20650 [Brevibacillus fluminis]|uniref:hypothetical protein n=1 Tax=Brevibacillus fluminis TaxID=511487 RepID=UPI003F8B2422
MTGVLLFFSVFSLFMISLEIMRVSRMKRADYLTLITLVFILFFGVAPILWYWAVENRVPHYWGVYGDFAEESFLIILVCLVTAFFFAMRLGWSIGTYFCVRRQPQPLADETFCIKNITVPAWVLFFLSFVSYYLYTKAYGGFIGIFHYTTAIRGGWIDVENSWSFLQRFGGLSMFSSYLFYCGLMYQAPRFRKPVHLWAGFAVSFLFSIYVLLTWEGRLGLATYILTFFLTRMINNPKDTRMWKTAGLFTTFGILLYYSRSAIALAKDALLGSTAAEQSHLAQFDIFDFYLKEFSFPLVSIYTSVKETYHGFFSTRLFLDYPTAVLYLIPKSWMPPIPDKISTINTHFIDPGFVGEIPTDMISLGVYNLGVFGAPVLAVLFGIFARVLQHQMTKIYPSSLRAIMTVVFGLWIAKSVIYNDPVNMLMAVFYIAAGGGITWVYMKLRPAARRSYL